MTRTHFRRIVQFTALLLTVAGNPAMADEDARDAGTNKAVPAATWQPRPLVKNWKVEDLAEDVEQDLSRRSLQRGRAVYHSARCIQCHRVNGMGGAYGAKISDLTSRFTGRALLHHILEPSLEIAKGYETHTFLTRGGRVLAGFIVKNTANTVHVAGNPNHPEETVIVQKADIEERRKSSVSTMPAGALDSYNREEILNLIAFIQSNGKRDKNK